MERPFTYKVAKALRAMVVKPESEDAWVGWMHVAGLVQDVHAIRETMLVYGKATGVFR